MGLEELNIQIINFLGEKNKQYSKDLNDAFEIEDCLNSYCYNFMN